MTTEGPPTSGPSPRPLHWDARRVLRVLAPLPPATAPALVVLCGLPGAGKSTLARAIAASAPAVVISSDHIRKTLVKAPQYTDREHRRVFTAALNCACSLSTRDCSISFSSSANGFQ